jgi:glycosyltransferase involved in cell wall biosynthesis
MANYRIFLHQPAIPEYLLPLIQELNTRLGPRLLIETTRIHQGTQTAPELIEKIENGSVDWVRLIDSNEFFRNCTWFHNNFRRYAKRGDVLVFAGNPRFLSNYSWLFKNGKGTVWWGQGWGSNTSKRSARIRLIIANLYDVRLFYDQLEEQLIGRWSRAPTFYINNTIAYSNPDLLRVRERAAAAFCFIGRLTKKANVILLPMIALKLKELGLIDFSFGIIGDGPEMDRLKAIIRDSKLDDSFNFHGPVYDREFASEVLRKYNFSIYPGAIGLTTQHSLSEGLPVITCGDYSKHNPEARLLQDGVNAIFAEQNVSSFAEACFFAAKLTDDRYQEMQKNCLNIRETHSIALMADSFVKACDSANKKAAKKIFLNLF